MSDPTPVSAPAASTGPLGELALAFSGGGYRAAAFHLGALRLLNRMDLLRDVVAISTVSGGSIVGAAWVLGVMDGRPFAEFDARFTAFLRETNVIREALDHLTSHRRHGHPDAPSLIRSAARVYARPELFGDRRLAEIRVPAAGGVPLREVILNSTEFRTGVDFRFRRSASARAKVGNGNLPVPREVAERVRVADAVGASSCFPGGFEPLLFPDHFAWPADYPVEKVRGALGKDFEGGVALMDGGIYDNQGVDSLMLAFRDDRTPPTLIVSDVDARNDDIYNFPKGHRRGFLTLGMAAVLGWLLFAASAGSMVALFMAGLDEWREGTRGWPIVLLYVVPFVFALCVAGGLAYFRVLLGVVRDRLKEQVQISDAWHDLRKLTVLEALGLVELRVTSLLALTSSVFMKRIRGLIVTDLFDDPKYAARRVTNLIYALNESRPTLYGENPWLEPSAALKELAATAEKYPTTLWFDRPEDLEMLARAGEVTTCFNLLKVIVRDRKDELKDPESPLSKLYARLRQEWDVHNGAAASRAGAVPAAPAPVA